MFINKKLIFSLRDVANNHVSCGVVQRQSKTDSCPSYISPIRLIDQFLTIHPRER